MRGRAIVFDFAKNYLKFSTCREDSDLSFLGLSIDRGHLLLSQPIISVLWIYMLHDVLGGNIDQNKIS